MDKVYKKQQKCRIWDFSLKVGGGKEPVKKRGRVLSKFFLNVFITKLIYGVQRLISPFLPLLKSCLSRSKFWPVWPPVTFIKQFIFFHYSHLLMTNSKHLLSTLYVKKDWLLHCRQLHVQSWLHVQRQLHVQSINYFQN